MLQIRRSEERGQADHGWLYAKHTFSFSEYYDDRFLGFRDLRVINEDRVQPGAGFPMHPHKSMEILTYILDGALEHKDSMGNVGVIYPGEVQYMSAGAGVVHSEYNHSKTEAVHLLQIWILPEHQGGPSNYGQKSFSVDERKNKLRLIASHDGREDSILIRQNAHLYASLLDADRELKYEIQKGRHVWLQLAKGEITLNGERMKAGDGVAITDERALTIHANEDAEFLVFDLS